MKRPDPRFQLARLGIDDGRIVGEERLARVNRRGCGEDTDADQAKTARDVQCALPSRLRPQLRLPFPVSHRTRDAILGRIPVGCSRSSQMREGAACALQRRDARLRASEANERT